MIHRLRTGIIGAGKVAHLHASALMHVNESAFSAICSRSRERAQAFARQYQVQPYTEVEEMIKVGGVQAVMVCTPHPAHAEVALTAMSAGAHVMVEKPLASSLADCDAMIAAARRARVKLAMISQRRLYAPVQRVKKAIADGKLDQPVLGTATMLGWRDRAYYASDPWRGTWRDEGGGVLVNQAPHQLDILQWLMGPIEEVAGCWANLNHPYIEVEDTALALIRFRSGALGNIIVSNSQNPALYGKVAVYGRNGAAVGVQTDGGAMFVPGLSKITAPPSNDVWTIPGEEHLLKQWQDEDAAFFQRIEATTYYHQLQIKDFLSAIVENRDPMVTGEEGRKTVELFTAIYRSQRDGKIIKLPLTPEAEREDFDGRLGSLR
ncbi:MAG: Gfo/Idh/MocA family protein [bacterium]